MAIGESPTPGLNKMFLNSREPDEKHFKYNNKVYRFVHIYVALQL